MMLDLHDYTNVASFLILTAVTLAWYIKRRVSKRYGSLPTLKVPLPSQCQVLLSRTTLGSGTFLSFAFQILCGTAKLFHKDGLVLFWILWRPFIFVHKAELIKELINHPAALAKSAEYELVKYFFGNGTATSDGDVWRKHRKVATPAFGKGPLKEYIPVFNKRAVEIIEKFRVFTNQPWIDPSSLLGSCVLNIASDAIMGMQLEGDERVKDMDDYKAALTEYTKTGAIIMSKPWLNLNIWRLFSPTVKNFFQSIDKLQKINEKVMERKLAQYTSRQENFGSDSLNGCFKNSLMDMLIDYHMKDPSFTIKDVKDDVNTFISAGYDTTAIVLKWLLFFVGLEPKIQDRIFSELESIFGQDTERMPSIEDLNEMKYMECVIKETLRLCPPIPLVARALTEDVHVDKYTIPKNVTVVFNFYMLHRDPELYPNPEEFRPERFLSENTANHHQFGFLSFSGGARNCIGQKFAMLEMKVIVCHIIRNFHITSLDHRDKIQISWEAILNNLESIRLRISPRIGIIKHLH